MENVSSDAADSPRVTRILAIDYGTRRMGLAVTDELGVTAQGLPTLHRTNKRNDYDHLRRTIKQYTVGEIVVGLPLRMSGEAGTQSGKVEEFAETLRDRFKLPVHLFDERLTSVEANRVLDETEISDRRRKEVVDQLAAVLILQAFMGYRAARRDC
jgi:putative Holliday junction resolvase